MRNPEKYASKIKSIANSLGFDFCGIAKAEFLEEEAPGLENWPNKITREKWAISPIILIKD